MSQLCSSYKFHSDSKPTSQVPVYNKQVSSVSKLYSIYNYFNVRLILNIHYKDLSIVDRFFQKSTVFKLRMSV